MGDYYQWIADLDATESDAEESAERLRGWLIDSGIIAAETSDCLLGEGPGHRPGPGFARAIEKAEVDDADPEFMGGVEIHVGRAQFYPGGFVGPIKCRRCDRLAGDLDPETFEPADDPEIQDLVAAAERWADGGSAEVVCTGCGNASHLNDWRWGYGAMAVGYAGVTFWNWPTLADEFARELSEAVGHRVRDGHLQSL